MTRKRRPIPIDLCALLALGFALRLGVWWTWPNVQWADEIYQVTEPAHRLVFGNGIVAWEWLVGIRSWLLPAIIAGLMELGRVFGGDDPELINLPFEIVMAALGCLPVLCSYLWGRNLYGRSGGVIAGFVTAVWSDLVYMSPHTFNEVVAADLLMLGLFLGSPGATDTHPSDKRLFWSGVVLGLVFAFRFHLGPALAIAGIAICGRQRSFWHAFITGAAIPVIGLGILDWITLSTPFQSIWLNIWYNIVDGVSAESGTSPFWLLPFLVAIIWLPALPVMLPAIYLGARRLPVPGVVAATIFATHSLFPHKEYRFIYPAIPLLVTIAGLGTAHLFARIVARISAVVHRDLIFATTLMLWSGMSLWVASQPFMRPSWSREAGFFGAFREINQIPQVCGVATNHALASPGSAWLRPDITLYQMPLQHIHLNDFSHVSASFNAIAANSIVQIRDPRYRRLGCHDGNIDADGAVHLRVCVWLRPGGCDARAAPSKEPYWPDYFRKKMGLPPFDWASVTSEAGP